MDLISANLLKTSLHTEREGERERGKEKERKREGERVPSAHNSRNCAGAQARSQ